MTLNLAVKILEYRMRISKKTKEKHEKRILETASSLFLKHGYARVGVDQIMQKAGLTSGALYSRFSGKEEILWSLFNQGSVRVQNSISKKKWLSPFDPYYKEDWQLLIRLIWDMGRTHPRTQRSHARLWKDYLEWIELGLEKKKIGSNREELKNLAKIVTKI
jgi:AcrR family transcriptional regulator